MEYTVPSKRIVSKEDLDEFLASEAYSEYIGYIIRLNESVKNLKIDTEVEISKVELLCKSGNRTGRETNATDNLECTNDP